MGGILYIFWNFIDFCWLRLSHFSQINWILIALTQLLSKSPEGLVVITQSISYALSLSLLSFDPSVHPAFIYWQSKGRGLKLFYLGKINLFIMAWEGKSHVKNWSEYRVLARGEVRAKISSWSFFFHSESDTSMSFEKHLKSGLHRTEKVLEVTHNITPFHSRY